MAVIRFIKHQSAFPTFLKTYYDKFGTLLDDAYDDALHNVIFCDTDEEISDFIHDTIQINIHSVKAGELFDFTDYEDWDSKNLYDVLLELQTGKKKKLSMPNNTDVLFL